MKKLTKKEMLMVNGGITVKSEAWDLDTCEHIMHWSDGTTTREPMEKLSIIMIILLNGPQKILLTISNVNIVRIYPYVGEDAQFSI